MKKTILIVSPVDDIHALAVKKRIGDIYPAIDCIVFDTASFPIASEVDWVFEEGKLVSRLSISGALASSIGPSAAEVLESLDKKEKINLCFGADCAIWNRRYRKPMLRKGLGADEFYAYSYSAQLSSLIPLLNGKQCFNSWFDEEAADLKAYQLRLAAETGLNIPETLISANGDQIRTFYYHIKAAAGEVIYKELSNDSIGMPTRILHERGLEKLQKKELAPMIFQRRITGVDVRVALVGESLFACDWRSERNEDEVDIRMQEGTKMYPSSFPAEEVSKLIAFQQRLQLQFGIYDFKKKQDGSIYFLEINPSGQWLDMEIDGGQAISEAIARWLAEGKPLKKTTEPLYTRVKLEEIAFQARLPMQWEKIAVEHV